MVRGGGEESERKERGYGSLLGREGTRIKNVRVTERGCERDGAIGEGASEQAKVTSCQNQPGTRNNPLAIVLGYIVLSAKGETSQNQPASS